VELFFLVSAFSMTQAYTRGSHSKSQAKTFGSTFPPVPRSTIRRVAFPCS